MGPKLRLRHLDLEGVWLRTLGPWVQQQLLAPTLTSLRLNRCGQPTKDELACLTGLTRLRQLELSGHGVELPCGLSAATSLTKLQLDLRKQRGVPELLSTMTQLRHLKLSGHADLEPQQAGCLAALSALTHLNVSATFMENLCRDGDLPSLEELGVNSDRVTVPGGCPRLVRLRASHMAKEPKNLAALTSLRELDLSHTPIHNPAALSRLTGLEVLVLHGAGAQGPLGAHKLPPGLLGGLTRLRYLDLHQAEGFHAAAFASPQGLPQLTYLDLSGTMADPTVLEQVKQRQQEQRQKEWDRAHGSGSEEDGESEEGEGSRSSRSSSRRSSSNAGPEDQAGAAVEGVLQLGPLPRLQVLNLSHNQLTSLAPLGPWLAQCSGLTQLDLSGNPLASPEELGHLPEQLQDLDLSNSRKWLDHLPRCLTRLTGLTRLAVRDNTYLDQLPAWLSQLQLLQELDLWQSGVETEQEVLRQLPLLRRVRLCEREVAAGKVYGSCPHLHWGQK